MRKTVSIQDTITSDVPPTGEVAAFVAVAECASFTLAAQRLGVGKSSLGKAVQRLEARLGLPLLRRSTRTVRVTDEGATYLEAARGALSVLREAGRAVLDQHAAPAGHLRVDLPAGIGHALLPSLADFTARYPGITLELSLADRYSNVLNEGWDVAVRVGLLEDSSLIAHRLRDLRLGLYGSPAYLTRRGTPATIGNLPGHDAIVLRTPDGQLKPWLLYENGTSREYTPPPRLIVADSHALIEAVSSGFGIAMCFDVTAATAVAAGRVVPVLPDNIVPGPPIHAVLPPGRAVMPAKSRALVEHLHSMLNS